MDAFQKALKILFAREIGEDFATEIAAGTVELTDIPEIKTLIHAKNDKITELTDACASATQARKTAEESLASLKAELELLKPLKESKEAEDKKIREEAVAMYKVVSLDSTDETMVELINETTIEKARTLRDKFRTEFEKSNPMKCKKCGSTEVDRAHSLNAPEPKTPKSQNDGTITVPDWKE